MNEKMKQMIKNWMLISVCYLLWIISFVPVTYAEENGSLNFSVMPMYPPSQTDRELGYYDLLLEPGKKQTIQLRVRSLVKEPTTIEISLENGITNTYGHIDYTSSNSLLDESLETPLTDIVHLKEEKQVMTIENFEEKEVTLEVVPPADPFKGIKLGAIKLEQRMPSGSSEENANYSYRIGIVLNEDRKPHNEGADLVLDDFWVGMNRGEQAINLSFRNPLPQTIEGLNIWFEFRKKGQDKLMFTHELTNGSMAPNSMLSVSIPWDIPWSNKDNENTKYTAMIYAGDRNKNWVFEKSFKVDKAMFQQDVAIDRATAQLTLAQLLICLTVLLINGIAFIVIRLRWWKQG